MDVSTIGQVTVDTDTRCGSSRRERAAISSRFEPGTPARLHHRAPGQFVVNTPSSTATDLGCVYTLHVDEDGTGLLSVIAGWVAFEHKAAIVRARRRLVAHRSRRRTGNAAIRRHERGVPGSARHARRQRRSRAKGRPRRPRAKAERWRSCSRDARPRDR